MILEQIRRDLDPLEVVEVGEDAEGFRIVATYRGDEAGVREVLAADYVLDEVLESEGSGTRFVVRFAGPR